MLDFSKSKVLIIGDIMLDKYWQGSVNRISPEGPIPIMHVKQFTNKMGGAGNAALNLHALGAQTHLMGIIGDDQYGKTLVETLNNTKIPNTLITTNQAPTVTKIRIIGHNQQLIRLDIEENLKNLDKTDLLTQFKNQLDNFDIVLISDYNKGTLSEVTKLIKHAISKNKKVLIDPKGDNFDKYQGATLLKPNLKEFELIVGQCTNQEDLITKAIKLREKLKLEYLMITQGEKGMTLIKPDNKVSHIKAYAKEVYDVTGAGDTVIATMAAAIGAGYTVNKSMNFANIAASYVVQKLGAATISTEELQKQIYKMTPIKMGALSREELAQAVQTAQGIGKIIVFTNGCFDLIHAGHVEYLEKAKQQGDLLIVGVNDDQSIRRLKGKDRPVSTLESRLTVLSKLSCVDWVVPFHEDTPENLLELIKPDILVKGTDYEIHEIVGHKIVQGYGGEVRRISHEHGQYSTSEYIAKIKKIQ